VAIAHLMSGSNNFRMQVPRQIARGMAATPHIPELQSIRGIAALVVVVGHCISYYATPDWWMFAKAVANTKAAVTIFFILSGFVLTFSLQRRPINLINLAVYYLKRFFRIYPALLVASCVALAYVSALHYDIDVPNESRWLSERFKAERFAPLHIITSFLGISAYLIPPVWTICVEILASILLPGLAFLLIRSLPAFWSVIIGLVLLSIVSGGRFFYHLDMYLMDFAVGASMVVVSPEPLRRLRQRGLPLGLLVAGAAVLLLFGRAVSGVDLHNHWIHLYESGLSAFIIFCFARVGLQVRWLRHDTAVWLGDISYSVYLLHFTVLCVLAKLFAVLMPEVLVTIGGVWAGLLLCLVSFLVVIPLSGWMYRRVELAGIALGGRLIQAVLRLPVLRRAGDAEVQPRA
jgi:peptidoglycan/LPS O-acetylase OafA/YrhL